MLTPEGLRELVKADATHPDRNPEARRAALEEAVRGLRGNADGSDVVSTALTGLQSDDRNMRISMLRVLSLYPDDAATDAVVRHLSDPKRRVREMAMKSLRSFHMSNKAIETLRAIAENESETNRLRRIAFFVLSSNLARDALPEVTRESLSSLMGSSSFRLPILVRLCKSLDQTPETRALLHDFVRTGTKEEAVMATRALSGFCLARVDAWLDAEQRQRLRDTCDRAPETRGSKIGDSPVNYWVPRDAVVELLRDSAYRRLP